MKPDHPSLKPYVELMANWDGVLSKESKAGPLYANGQSGSAICRACCGFDSHPWPHLSGSVGNGQTTLMLARSPEARG